MTVEIKICGITNVADAQAAVAQGVDYLGFNFYAKSPRAVSPDRAKRIMDRVGDACKAVGVFVNMPRDEVEQVVRACGLWAAQLHGDEEASDFVDSPIRLWRALNVTAAGVSPDPEGWGAERYVVDAMVPGIYGGTGMTADWDAAGVVAGRLPVLLAGGLVPENVAEAIRIVRPYGVDVASGVEACPGTKDHAKMEAFVKRVREAAAGEHEHAEE